MERLSPNQEPLPVRRTGHVLGILEKADRCIALLTKILFAIAGIGLVAMLVLIVADVVGIKVLSHPVPGGIEIVSFLAVIAVAFAVGYTQVLRGHVAVDFIVDQFPRRVKLAIDVLMTFFSVCLFGLMSYYSVKYAAKLSATSEVSMTQKIPFYPFVYAMAGCFMVTFLTLTVDLVKAIARMAAKWTR